MNNLIEILHSVSNKLTDITDEQQIYQIMNDGIKQILPDSYFVITKLQPDDMNFRISHSFGFDKYFTAIKTLIGKDPFQMDFPFSDLSETKQKQFESRKLYHASEGIYDMVNGKINKTICKTIEKILGISEVYAISFCIGEEYFGGSTIFTRKTNHESGKLCKDCILAIENIAAQASFAINNLRDLDLLTKNENELKIANKELESQNEEKAKRTDELRKAKEKIEISETKYKDLVETADIAILIDDENGFLKYYNNRFCEIFGYTNKEIDQLPIRSLVHPDDVEIVMNHHNNRISGKVDKSEYEFRGVKKNGEIVQLMTSVVPYRPHGKIIGSRSYVWDITKIKHAEQALKENERLLVETQKIGKIGGWSHDVQTQKMTFTDTIFEIYGKSFGKAEEGVQDYHPEDKGLVWNAFSDAISKQKPYDLEVRFINANGGHLYVRTIGKPVIEDGKVIKVNGILMDITQRKKAELKLKASEQKLKLANATKDKFFSIIAHDLRSPFTNIVGFSQLLVDDTNDFDSAEIEKFLSIINSSAKNTLSFLDNLLNWAKSQTGQISFKPERVVLSTVIQTIIELLNPNAQKKNILLHFNPSEENTVFADLNMLKTIIRNLISNAIKFTHSNGKIELSTIKNGNYIEISVSDNGVGMDKESQNKLFCLESNLTTMGTANEKGSGLGLILCKEFVEKHGGEIWVESDPDSHQEDKGSTFKFTLPLKNRNE